MDYKEALSYIEALPKFTYPLGNKQLSELLERIDSPQNGLKIIHIAGTNGKGSASAMIASVLTEAGYKTGLFTSPYILRFNERIRIGTCEIPDYKLAEIVYELSRICNDCDIKISQFAFILACAFLYYDRTGCEYVVLEAGMGGRLDATNVILMSEVSVIMSIGLDHTIYSGNTIAEIAAEKCGIIKQFGDVVSYRNLPEAMAVIEDYCRKKEAKLYVAKPAEKTKTGFFCDGKNYELTLGGAFQADNAAVVLSVIDVLRKKGTKISDENIEIGLAECRWRGRFEKIGTRLIVDCGHNPDGIRALCDSLRYIEGKKTAVVAMMEDKDAKECIKILSQNVDGIITTHLDMPRCMDAGKLSQYAKNVEIEPDVKSAIKKALQYKGVVVVCGSVYLAGKVLDIVETSGSEFDL